MLAICIHLFLFILMEFFIIMNSDSRYLYLVKKREPEFSCIVALLSILLIKFKTTQKMPKKYLCAVLKKF